MKQSRPLHTSRAARQLPFLAHLRRLPVAIAMLLLAMTAQTAWADDYPAYITDVMVIGGDGSTVNSKWATYQSQGYKKVDFDLNSGAGGDYVYVLYKTGSRNSTDGGYITDLVVSTTDASSVTYNGTTYTRVAHDGSDHFKKFGGNLNSSAKSGSTNMWLFYTKKNFSNKRAVNDIVVNTSSSKSGYTTIGKNGGSSAYDLNDGAGGDYVYMHFSTTTKRNRPASDPTMKTGLVYTGQPLQLVSYNPTSQCTMNYRVGTSGSYTSTVSSITATNAGTYTVYYYAATNSYGDYGPTFSKTVTISKAANSGVTVSCADVMEGTTPQPVLGGTNLSTGDITYLYSTSQNGTYSSTVPNTAGTYWVKATIAADANCNEYTTAAASFTMTPDWARRNSGDSEADAYVINTTADLDLLASRVNAGNNYSGKFFRLGANITYDGTENNFTPIGVYGAPFAGTFDGGGLIISGLNINQPSTSNIGLFGMAGSAVIKNLTLANSTFCGNIDVGAILGDGRYNSAHYATVENCVVASTVTVTGDNYVGGIVGEYATVRGCVCAATVSAATTGSPIIAGGIISNGTRSTVSHCLYTGTSVTANSNKGAIAGYKGSGYLSNNYYTQATISGTDEGDTDGARRAVAINTYSGVTATMTGAATTYSHSGITAYASNRGLLYNGQLYAGNVETVNLDITYASPYEGFSFSGYTDGNGHTLTHASGNTYKLQMTAATATITPDGQDLWGESTDGRDGSTAAKAFRITTPAGLDLLAKKVNGTDGYTANNYSGKYFELGDDIDYSEVALTLDDGKSNYAAIGYYNIGSDMHAFSGHFDGLGHKISGIVIDKEANNQGIFGYIEGDAEVKNLTLTNATITIGNNNYNVGGIAGQNVNISVIENCHVTASVTVSAPTSSYAGGIVGVNNAYVRGCTSAATVSAKSNAGAIAGEHGYGTIRNCLVLGANVTANATTGAIVGYLNGGTLTNNRYTAATTVNGITGSGHGTGNSSDIDGQATVAYQFPADIDDPSIMGTQGTTYGTGTYQGITAYENGLAYQSHLYYPSLWTGNGYSPSDPYVIYTTEGLDRLADMVNNASSGVGNFYALGHDIAYDKTTLTLDLDGNGENDSNFPGIGDYDQGKYFYGSLDGRGHAISGIVINRPNTNFVGLIARNISGQNFENLTLANSDITGSDNVGGIAGEGGSDRNIRNCHVLSDVTISGNAMVGGIVGKNANVFGCTSAAAVTAITKVGGIVGYNPGYTVQDCLYLGNSVTATSTSSKYAGAIIGNSYYATMANNYYTAYGLGGVGSDSNATGTDTDGAQFAVSSTTKPDNFGNATATYGTGTYQGITAYGTNGLEYDGKYYWHVENLMELADRNEDNSSIIVENNGQTVNVVLKDRTLYKDGAWNIIRLPFNVDMTDPDGPLYGATFCTVSGASIEGTSLNLTFGKTGKGDKLVAGTPYLIKWDRAADYVDDDAHNIVNPVFTNVKPANVGRDFWNEDRSVWFTGGYVALPDITTRTMSGYDVLLLDADNTLHYAGSGASLGACRAYFLVKKTGGSGDVTGDGAVTIADVALIIDMVKGDESSADADVTGDGLVDMADVLMLKDVIIGKQSTHPVTTITTNLGDDTLTLGGVTTGYVR